MTDFNHARDYDDLPPMQVLLSHDEFNVLRAAARPKNFDAVLKPLSDDTKKGWGILTRETTPAVSRYRMSRYSVVPGFQRFVDTVLAGNQSPVALFLSLPEDLKAWFCARLSTPAPSRPRALIALGLISYRGSDDWRMTRLGNSLHPTLKAAAAAAAAAPDDWNTL